MVEVCTNVEIITAPFGLKTCFDSRRNHINSDQHFQSPMKLSMRLPVIKINHSQVRLQINEKHLICSGREPISLEGNYCDKDMENMILCTFGAHLLIFVPVWTSYHEDKIELQKCQKSSNGLKYWGQLFRIQHQALPYQYACSLWIKLF